MSALLEVQGVSRTFGPTRAVDHASFAVQPGELLGLIGPNGAGKSTLFNLIAGVMSPSGGKIVLDGTDVTGWKSYDMARAGIARTFQIPKPYRQLSVIENVMISAFLRERSMVGARDLANVTLSDLGLAPYRDRPACELTVGLLKGLEVARALALRPRLVLFYEMVPGLPAPGMTVVWVEHVLYAIMKTATRMVVINRGSVIAQGAPAEVARDPAVVKAYLGEVMQLA